MTDGELSFGIFSPIRLTQSLLYCLAILQGILQGILYSAFYGSYVAILAKNNLNSRQRIVTQVSLFTHHNVINAFARGKELCWGGDRFPQHSFIPANGKHTFNASHFQYNVRVAGTAKMGAWGALAPALFCKECQILSNKLPVKPFFVRI